MVPRAVVLRLEAICEPDVPPLSHGLRKSHSPQHALHALREPCRTLHSPWRVEAAVRGCCDQFAWGVRREFIPQRGKDGGILRLLGKWLHAGVLAAGELPPPDQGPPQGGVASPLLTNVFLHQVLDEWFVKDVQPRMKGRCVVTRFADDFIIGCELEADACRVMAVLPKRFNCFSLTIHPEKTALIAFKRPPSREPSARGTGSFAFLGFTHYWAKPRRGYWVIKRKTVGKRQRRIMQAIWTWCRDNRHAPVHEQYQTLCLKLRGYYQYYGIRGNFKMLEVVFEHTERAWRYWRSRRSHKGHIRWQQVGESIPRYLPRPHPRSMHHISERPGQHSDAPSGVSPAWFAVGRSVWLPRNRMRETCTSGSVGRAPGNRCLYPEPDCLQRPLRSRFRQQVSASVRRLPFLR